MKQKLKKLSKERDRIFKNILPYLNKFQVKEIRKIIFGKNKLISK